MFKFLFALFVLIPLLEMALLIHVGGIIGMWPTLFMVIATAALGILLVRREGLRTLINIQQRLSQQHIPGKELLDGAMILVAGALLLTPGFFTDAIGFLLVFPISRSVLRATIMHLLAGKIQAKTKASAHASILEGEFRRDPPDNPDNLL